MAKPITILLVGAGSRGRTVYGRFALDNPETAKIVAVAEPIASRREAVAAEHDLDPALCFDSWERLRNRETLADVAIVATDDRDHLDPAVTFLRQGYHLLLEKPMACELQHCEQIVRVAKESPGMSAVSHVLRYTPYYKKIKSLILDGAVGEVVSIRHFEPVNHWHFAHSFVRGNWRDSKTTSPFILAKCCHDMDIVLYLIEDAPSRIQSFGSLHHFKPSKAPAGAAGRCTDCELENSCTYSASRFYGGMLERDEHWWPLDVVTQEFTKPALARSLEKGPFGRCVYQGDNNVCDHQVVNIEFQSGVTASVVATAFTECPARETDVMGSAGMLRGDGNTIIHHDFNSRKEQTYRVESQGHHLGGDEAMLTEFFAAISSNKPELLSSSTERSILSHRMALLAEQSRLEGRVLDF